MSDQVTLEDVVLDETEENKAKALEVALYVAERLNDKRGVTDLNTAHVEYFFDVGYVDVLFRNNENDERCLTAGFSNDLIAITDEAEWKELAADLADGLNS